MFKPFTLQACGQTLSYDRPQLVGILNVTPDSFSDGGRYLDVGRAVDHAERMVEAGAAWLDIGAESTRPGAEPVSGEEETARLLPVLEQIAKRLPVPISIDTTKAAVARRALDAGAVIINDVSALRFDSGMAAVIAERKAAVILMHMQGTPRTMQRDPRYRNVTEEVRTFLGERQSYAERQGISQAQIVLDPGFGFGKLGEHNVSLLRDLSMLTALGPPLMVGISRKAFLGQLTGRSVHDRAFGLAAALALAVERGAALLRVHDVEAMRDVVAVTSAVVRPASSSAAV